ncbi:hypothetical protein C8Q74DRAFT_966700 [Fomes fomentarius]|nr:hypothetical protein C8Q74DRAFT_966700 [Fomes fomentarius]
MSSKAVEERERDILLGWVRDPNGAILHRNRAPPGFRTPHGFIWGHQLAHFFWIPRNPDVEQYVTIWSRSMIKEFGEGYDDHEWDEPLVPPRLVRPWPVLQVLNANGRATGTLNARDRGCNLEHSQMAPHDEGSVGKRDAVESPEMPAVTGGCPYDPEGICTGPLLANVGPERLKNEHGMYYGYIWCDHVKERFNRVQHEFARKISITGAHDTAGSSIYVPSDSGDDAIGNSASPEYTHPDSDSESARAAGVVVADPAEDLGEKPLSNATITPLCNTASAVGVENEGAARDLHSVDGLPKLEEFIPSEYLPDVLLVHDPQNVTRSRKADHAEDKDEPIQYKRFYPFRQNADKTEDSGTPPKENIAHLHLSQSNRLGSGHHSYVYRAPLTLPPPLSARSPTGQVTVAAKLAYNRCTAHGLLHNEARVYDSLPKHTQEEWCGYEVVPQCRFPVPVGAVAPKFFGYYLPVDENGKIIERKHTGCQEDYPCTVEWSSPILLMEECGTPVDPSEFTADQRTECFTLIMRLHHLRYLQGSPYVRNILIQPGPLTLPPDERTYKQPSFRIIDYGRGKLWDWEVNQPDVENRKVKFITRIRGEADLARSELLIEIFGF